MSTTTTFVDQQFPKLHDRPIVGILAVMSDHASRGRYCLPASYVRNVEASGARVAPILPDRTDEQYYRQMFSHLNGLLIPGGSGAPLEYQRPVTEVARVFYDLCVKSRDDEHRPTYWPIWGTCLGFEILATISANMSDVLSECRCPPASYPLTLVGDVQDSRLWSRMPEDIVQAMSSKPIMPHLHAYCLTWKTFEEAKLDKFYRLSATHKDLHGVDYVVAMESKRYPIYGVMSHQEKAAFQWNNKYKYDHSASSIRLAQELMNFFVQECCRNPHRFDEERKEEASLIQNYTSVYTAPLGSSVDECFYFN